MRDCKTAAGEVCIERLYVAQARTAGGGIAHMPSGHIAGQFRNGFRRGEILCDMAKPAAREELLTVIAGDAGRLLPAVLQGMQPQSGRRRSVRCVDSAKHATFLAQLVAKFVEERISPVHAEPAR